MKAILLILALFLAARASAQWAVIDAANIIQNTMTALNTLEEVAKAAEQISNQVQQIKQMEDQLTRLGKMRDVTSLVGFSQLKLSVESPSLLRNWNDLLGNVDGVGILSDTRGGIYKPIGSSYRNYDGAPVAYAADDLKPAHAVTTQVDNFKAVQTDVYRQREALRKSLDDTSEALRMAQTEAEEMKLQATLQAQYTQLQDLNQQVLLSAAETQVKQSEVAAMKDAEEKTNTQARTALAQQEANKITSAYTTNYQCALKYVEERQLGP